MKRLLLTVGAAALLALGFAAGALVHVGVNSLWIPVVAALGASLLTGIFGFGGEALRDRRSGAIDAERRRRDACVEFLIAANGQIAMVSTIRELRRLGTQAGGDR